MRGLMCILIIAMNFGCNEPKDAPATSWESLTVDSTIIRNVAAEELIKPYRELIDEEMNRILVHSDTIIYKVQPESPLSNLVADLSFERASLECIDNGLPEPDFCLLNFGGLRVDLPKGEIPVRKVFELMPFENELVVVEVTADSLQSLLNYLVSVGGQPVSNLSMTWSESNGIQEVKVNGEPINREHSYYVVTTDYLANGGDKMSFFKNPVSRASLGVKLRDAIIDHFESVGRSGETLSPKMDGRLNIEP